MRGLIGAIFGIGLLVGCSGQTSNPQREPPGLPLFEIESSLRAIAEPLARSEPGDWLRSHPEEGQSFADYLQLRVKRRSGDKTAIYVILLGEMSPEQLKILDVTRDYLSAFFQAPVVVHRRFPLDVIPVEGRRVHPHWGTPQVKTRYVLDHLLRPERPSDALAYLCFTSSDLCSDATENYVLGEARAGERLGVWSIYRNGDPNTGPDAYRRCLRRTMHIATHETGHILAMRHCVAFQCNMNGANSPEETDRHPLHFCPVCLRKLLWNLTARPADYLAEMEKFCREHDFADEAEWYRAAGERCERCER
jgi:archaemetzincin